MSLPRYPAYTACKVTEIAERPSHWREKRLRFAAEVNPSKQEARGMDESQTVTFLPMEAIGEDGKLVLDTEKEIGECLTGYTYFREGDVCVAKITPCFENGKGAILAGLSGGIGFGTTELIVVRPMADQVTSKFLDYLFRSVVFRELGQAEMYGAGGQKRVPDSYVRDFVALLPSTKEQAKITAFLDDETAKIDALIAEQQRLIELLRERIKALALSGFEVRNGKAERVGRLVDVLSRPVSISESGIYEPLGLYNRGRGLFHKELRLGAEMGDSDFFFVESGDLIISGQFAWEGAVALAGNDENGCVVSHRYPVLVGRQDRCLTEFLLALLWTDHGDFLLNQCSRGAAGRNRPLNLDLLLKEEIRVPDPPEQEFVRDLVLNLLELDKEFAEQRSLALEYKSALISAAVTGQIDVRGLVPAEVDA